MSSQRRMVGKSVGRRGSGTRVAWKRARREAIRGMKAASHICWGESVRQWRNSSIRPLPKSASTWVI
jgi:hypothetical protein